MTIADRDHFGSCTATPHIAATAPSLDFSPTVNNMSHRRGEFYRSNDLYVDSAMDEVTTLASVSFDNSKLAKERGCTPTLALSCCVCIRGRKCDTARFRQRFSNSQDLAPDNNVESSTKLCWVAASIQRGSVPRHFFGDGQLPTQEAILGVWIDWWPLTNETASAIRSAPNRQTICSGTITSRSCRRGASSSAMSGIADPVYCGARTDQNPRYR